MVYKFPLLTEVPVLTVAVFFEVKSMGRLTQALAPSPINISCLMKVIKIAIMSVSNKRVEKQF